MDRLMMMAVFARVASNGSFAEAARHFRISPAAATKHVQMLEEWLGARLLNRTTRRVNLTEAGAEFYARCVPILEEVNDLRHGVSSIQDQAKGTLRINAPMTFGVTYLMPVIDSFLRDHPEVQVDLTLNEMIVDIIEEGVDLAIRIGRLKDSSLIARRLAPCRFALCAAPAYLAANEAPGRPADLAQHACLDYAYRQSQSNWTFQGPEGEESVRVQPRIIVNNSLMLREAALRGLGVILSPTFVVGPEIASGTLVPLMPDYTPTEAGIYAVYPQARYLPLKVRLFVDRLVSHFAGEPAWDRWQVEPPQQRNVA
ncbi:MULTISPECIES: LysR family transcriptional regulator [unclassified Chelatococcus]|uniref:LysR family transcriptional regulator n=1 Tax=unclassified Chelatococcus TaxID=2638111 RepID=UPI00030C83B1|nr:MULTISPECIES: LysR family transcriptional regulator [unclassified Chelatococcus]ALA18358.1 LysR family transcriptional regulator [Chelatococcus sp. CO-6]